MSSCRFKFYIVNFLRFLNQKIEELQKEKDSLIHENSCLINAQRDVENQLILFKKEKNLESYRFINFSNEISLYLQKINNFKVL